MTPWQCFQAPFMKSLLSPAAQGDGLLASLKEQTSKFITMLGPVRCELSSSPLCTVFGFFEGLSNIRIPITLSLKHTFCNSRSVLLHVIHMLYLVETLY